jgi:N-acetylneuraminic acid mutarotase
MATTLFAGQQYLWDNRASFGGGSFPAGTIGRFTSSGAVSGWTYLNKRDDSIQNLWIAKTAMPTARRSLGVVSAGNKIYAIGGCTDIYCSTVVATNEEYNPATNTWTTKASSPAPRYNSAVAAVNGKIYVIGGEGTACYAQYGVVCNVLNEEYDPATNAWTRKADMPTGRYSSTASTVNNKIYVIGGGVSGGYTTDKNEEYDPSTNSWTTKTPLPTARTNPASVVVSDKIYVVSGDSGIADSNRFKQNEEYDPATDNWTIKTNNPTISQYPMAASGSDRVYIIGDNDGYSNNTGEYNPLANTWATKTNVIAPYQWLGGAATVNNKIYLIGGRGNAYNPNVLTNNKEYNTTPLYFFSKD